VIGLNFAETISLAKKRVFKDICCSSPPKIAAVEAPSNCNVLSTWCISPTFPCVVQIPEGGGVSLHTYRVREYLINRMKPKDLLKKYKDGLRQFDNGNDFMFDT
jgi:hypothetical protein